MIFLIEYSRPQGRIITFDRFNDSQRSVAEKSKLEIEMDLRNKNIDHEVVLLEAASEDALRRTHRRYFEDISQIGKLRDDNAA